MGMEGKLFIVSLWWGVYGLILRSAKRNGWENGLGATVVLNSVFWGTALFLVGMLVSSYQTQAEYSFIWSLKYVGSGLALGAILGYLKGRKGETRIPLLRDNLEWADTAFSAILLASFFMFFILQAFKIPSGSMRMTFVEGDHLFVNKFTYGIRIPLTHKKLLAVDKPIYVPFTKIPIFQPVRAGHIVIFRFPADDKENSHYGKDFIKRCVATEGQTVRIIDKKLYVDGEEVVEEHIQHVDPAIFPSFLSLEPEEFQLKWENGDWAHSGAELRDNFGPVVVPQGHVFVMGDNRDQSFDSRFWGPLPLREVKGKALLRYWGPLPRDRSSLKFWQYIFRFKWIH
jgi:signal peptidase I